MKKRIGLGLLAVLLLVIGLSLWVMVAGGVGISTGRVLVADNGCVLLIKDNSPIVLGGGVWMTEGLATGDSVAVLHDGIAESYPAQTRAYFVCRLGGGTMDDIPADVLNSLREMGWIG